MGGRSIPHDADAEQHVIGACLVDPRVIEVVASIVSPDDFLRPLWKTAFAGIVDLHERGEIVDAAAMRSFITDREEQAELLSAMVVTPMRAERSARLIAEARARRQLIEAGSRIIDAAYEAADPSETLDAAVAELDRVDLPDARIPEGLVLLDDLLHRPPAERVPWVIPGLLRRDWRIVLVAVEGAGKTLVLQQVGMCASQGLHPFAPEEPGSDYEPQRVLFVDLENSEDRIVEGAELINPSAMSAAGAMFDRARAWVLKRPHGMNLRSRRDVGQLDAALSYVKPSLVCFGPLYKASGRERGEGWDEAAMASQRVLDGLRYRHRFALLMEDHAPQGSGGVRDLRPYGSSLWLRWPELGLKLVPAEGEPNRFDLGRWRFDRLKNSWPIALQRSEPWPWAGVWRRGFMPHVESQPQPDLWEQRADLQ